jgi:mRNA-degrading endonuclease toxin of MazEF toxin-antitoxin module
MSIGLALGEIDFAPLDPTQGSEVQKPRPAGALTPEDGQKLDAALRLHLAL